MKKVFLIALMLIFSAKIYSQAEKTLNFSEKEIIITINDKISDLKNIEHFAWIEDGNDLYYPIKYKVIDDKTISIYFADNVNLKNKKIKLNYFNENTGIIVFNYKN